MQDSPFKMRKLLTAILLLASVSIARAQTGTTPVSLEKVGVSTTAPSVNASDGGILVHTTNGGSGGTSSTFGAAFPAIGTAAGFKDAGNNMAAGNLDGSGNLKVAGTFSAAASTATVPIGYVSGGSTVTVSTNTPLPVQTTGTVTVAGTVTANAGTNLNTSLLALETGGNLSLLAGGISSSRYMVNIASWGGNALSTTNPIPTHDTGTVTITGTVTANAGTNLNTSALALESGGNLATLAGGVSGSKYQVNIASWGGAALSTSNPLPTHDTGTVTVAGTVSISGNINATVNTGVMQDSSAFTLGTSSSMPAGAVFIPNPSALGAGTTTQAAVRMSKYRAQYVTLLDENNVGLGTSTTNPLLTHDTGTVTITGTVTANAGTNLNTSLLALESGGNLATLAGGVTGSKYQVNIASWGGAALTTSNPIPTHDTGTVTVAGTVTSNQGTAGAIAWPVAVTQGTGTLNVSVLASTVGAVGTLADNGVAAATNRLPTMPSIYQTSYLNGTAATQGRNGALSQGTDGLLWTASLPALRPASYSASTNTITSAASATDITAICGNATNIVLVYGLRLSCTQTTAGNVPLTVVKRSSAYTGAWSTMTAVAQDSNYAVMASTAIFFTANPTVGTLVGHLDNYKLGCMATGTASPNDIYISPSDWKMKPIVLRGTAQCVGVNLEATTVTGGAFTVTWDWIETATITP